MTRCYPTEMFRLFTGNQDITKSGGAVVPLVSRPCYTMIEGAVFWNLSRPTHAFLLSWVLYRIQEYTSLSNWSVSRCSFRFVKSWYELMWWLIRISNRSDPTWLDHDRDACNCYPEWSSNPWHAGKSPICTQTYRSRFNKSFSYGMNIHRSRFRRLRGLY